MTAEQLRRDGNPQGAIDLCRDALVRFPGYLSARVTLGWALLDLGQLKQAREEFETVRRSAPDNFAAIRGLAQLHVLEDSSEEAYTFDPDSETATSGNSGQPADPKPAALMEATMKANPQVVARLESWLSRVEQLRAAV